MDDTEECNLLIGIDARGQLIRAARGFKMGEQVHLLRGETFPARNKYTIEIEGAHLVDPIAKYLNHSFAPNLRIEGYRVMALRDIDAGEELTFDYTTTETRFSHPFIDSETGRWVGAEPTVASHSSDHSA